MSCSNSKKKHKAAKVTMANQYLSFEIDSTQHTIGMAYGTLVSRDTVNEDGEAIRDTSIYVLWPTVLPDSTGKKPLKTVSGQDSTSRQWVELRKGALLEYMGPVKNVRTQ